VTVQTGDGPSGGQTVAERGRIAGADDSASAPVLRTAGLTAVTLCAFAANSVLARMALGAGAADPAGFTVVRLVSGALALWLIMAARGSGARPWRSGSWISAWWLFLYAAGFSFAYVSLPTGTGALVLFAAVQVTMILSGLRQGERPGPLQWVGLVVAMGGLVLLVAPGVTAPSPVGSFLMAAAGAAWGLYSVRGRGSRDPIAATAGNFARSVPMVAVVAAAMVPSIALTQRGFLLAVMSGAVASGLGYVLWYAALRGLSTTQASIVQLVVPVLAAVAGVVLLSEHLTPRLVVSGIAILSGVAVAVSAGRRA
jgi:drug/metabolite transporter (DMT)-like permease